MASTMSFGDTNAGFQAGIIEGPVNTTIQLPPTRRYPRPSPSCVIPFCRDPDFVDRGTLLDQIHKKCSVPASRIALVGLGGVGKSQLAIEYCYRTAGQSRETWVFWVHAGTQTRFVEGYRRIAEATKMDGWDNPKADILRLVRSWLCDEANGQWVMVVDNADDANVFFYGISQSRAAGSMDSPELLLDFLPQSPNGSILVTSRSQDVAYRLVGTPSNIIEVKPMNQDDALALLRNKFGYSINEDEAIVLIHALDSMPLALTQAAAFIKQRAPRMSVSKYIDEVRRSDHDRARLLQKDVGDSRRDGRASNSILATWQISFKHIREQTPSAARLLSLMSLFDRQGIPESLLRDEYGGGEDEEDEDKGTDFDDDIYTLTSFSLVEMSADGREFEMHRLVQFSTKKWLELSNELELWKETYVTLMDKSYPVGLHQNWKVCQALFPHAQVILNNEPKRAKVLKAWASVLFKAAWYMSEIGQYNKAYEMGSASLQVRETILGVEHPDTLNSLNSLGVVVNWQGRYAEAEAIHQRALETKEQVLGPKHPDTLTSMANLASTYISQGKWKEAEKLTVQVMETFLTVLGPDHPHTLSSMGNLASTYRSQGRWEEAEKLLMRAMKTRKRVFGSEHPGTLTSMGNLASTYRSQGRWKEAEKLFMQVIETRKRVLGSDHPDTLSSIGSLALTYKDQGWWKGAEELEAQLVETRKRVLGLEHPDTLTSVGNMALTFWMQKRLKEAEELFLHVIKTKKRVLGLEHPSTLNNMENLVSLYKNQNRWKEAEELEVQVMETRKKVLELEHPDT